MISNAKVSQLVPELRGAFRLEGVLFWSSMPTCRLLNGQNGHHTLLGMGQDMTVAHPIARIVRDDEQPDYFLDTDINRILYLPKSGGNAVYRQDFER